MSVFACDDEIHEGTTGWMANIPQPTPVTVLWVNRQKDGVVTSVQLRQEDTGRTICAVRPFGGADGEFYRNGQRVFFSR